MIIKIVTLFLIAMGVLAMFGRLRWPGGARNAKRMRDARRCPECGAYLIGDGPCACGHKGKG